METASVLRPEKAALFESISLSAYFVVQSTEELWKDIVPLTRDDAKNLLYSLALDMSTDLLSTSHCSFVVSMLTFR